MSHSTRVLRWILVLVVLASLILVLAYVNGWILFILLQDPSLRQVVALTGGEVGVVSLIVALRALRRQT